MSDVTIPALGFQLGTPASGPVTPRTDCDLDDFRAIVETTVDLADYPHASAIERGAVAYEAARLRDAIRDAESAVAVRNELTRALRDGPGIIVLAGSIAPDVVDRVTAAFERLIAQQKADGLAAGDHYAKPGANDRVWNAFEKLAVEDPEAFVDYYSNDMIRLGALSWLGPAYQISSQVNLVHPGGEAQMPHRDYHVGFMTDDLAEQYPLHAHTMSPYLTLQGAAAHCDMPVESGPTMYLPQSHKYPHGFLAWRRPEFIEYFREHHVQVPLSKGDIVFFSPAMFHGAGTNRTTDIERMANLLQISSAMARAMETMDHERIANAVYPVLLRRQEDGMDPGLLANAVAAAAECYAFPTNLDRDPPLGGLTPPSQADIVTEALAARTPPAALADQLAAHQHRTRSH